jgi:hypothetical protein
MVDGHRKRKDDPWRNITVQNHISAPVTFQSELAQQRSLARRRNRQLNSAQNDPIARECSRPAHISAPVTSQSELAQQRTSARRRDNQVNSAENGHSSSPVLTQSELFQQRKRRRVEAERRTPSQSLIDAYLKRKAATSLFPPNITAEHIRAAMRRYEEVVEDACAGVETSCASCGQFMAKADSGLIPVDDERLRLMRSPEGLIQMDSCVLVDGSYQVCDECLKAFNRGKIPKFSALNAANVTMCPDYPAELEELTLMEEYVIARSHPIGTILKLKPNGIRNPAAYNGIRGHIVTIPQDPGPLLDILPSPDLQFHDHIRIVWTGKSEPTVDDLRPFAQVRKEKVIRALLWLCEHNTLYKTVQINHELLNQWTESFVPHVLQEAVVNLPEAKDSDERGTYAGDMDGFSENDLHNALDDMADDTIASGAVYCDVEGQRQSPELKMVMALMEMLDKPDESVSDADSRQHVEIPVITWVGEGRRVLLNDYDNPEYFTGAFPTLFPYGRGGHLPTPNDRNTAISLEAWAKWLLNHHSRR